MPGAQVESEPAAKPREPIASNDATAMPTPEGRGIMRWWLLLHDRGRKSKARCDKRRSIGMASGGVKTRALLAMRATSTSAFAGGSAGDIEWTAPAPGRPGAAVNPHCPQPPPPASFFPAHAVTDRVAQGSPHRRPQGEADDPHR